MNKRIKKTGIYLKAENSSVTLFIFGEVVC